MPSLRFDDAGLIATVAQDWRTGEIRMVAWMNAEALRRTAETGRATFYSRSRKTLWEKGATSGNGLRVRSICVDCDGDTVLLLVDPEGPSCHTGRRSCFFREVDATGAVSDRAAPAGPFLQQLEAVLEKRKTSAAAASYTRSLLDGGAGCIGAKLREESEELAVALEQESDERVAEEAADVLYHLLVGLQLRGLSLQHVIQVLVERSGTSGLVEKRSRSGGG